MKRILLPILQVSIAIALMWWIFRDPAKNKQMLEGVQAANPLWLIGGVLSVGFAMLFQIERWRQLMGVQGIQITWVRTVRIFLIGAFFNLFLLGATGGDVVKIYYAMQETNSKKGAAFLSVLVDRIIGLMALIAVTLVLCSLRWNLLMSNTLTQTLLGTLAVVMAGSLGVVVAGFIVDRFELIHKLPQWLPLHGKIVEMATAFSVYARAPGVLAIAFALSIPAHILNFLAFYFTARAFGVFKDLGGFIDIVAVLPIILTIAAIPLTPAGVGVREGLFEQVFLKLFGISKAVAVPISLIGFLMTVFWGLIGGLVYLAYRPSGGIHLKDVEEEVEAVEDSIENQA